MSFFNESVLLPTIGMVASQTVQVPHVTSSRPFEFVLLSLVFTVSTTVCAARYFFRTSSQTKQQKGEQNIQWEAPSVSNPAWILLQLLLRPMKTLATYECFSLRVPIRFNLCFVQVFFNQGPSTVAALFNNRNLSAYFLHGKLLHNCFEISRGALNAYLRDDSGPGIRPAANTHVEPKNRLNYRHHKWHHDFLTGAGLAPLCKRFQQSFAQRLVVFRQNVAANQVDEHDLMELFRNTLTGPALIDSLLAPAILEQHPDFLQNFWGIHDNFRLLNSRLPRWLIPKPRAALAKCRAAIASWHSWARKHADPSGDFDPTAQDDPYWGSKSIRERQLFAETIDGFTRDDINSHDVAFAWAAAHNTVPTIFWQLIDVCNDPNLLQSIREEANSCHLGTSDDGVPQFDIPRLARQPYLQAVFAESLRFRTHGVLVRNPQHQTQVNKWSAPGGSYIAISSTTAHMDPVVWASAERGAHPVEKFAPERFLTKTEDGAPKFSMSGLDGAWIPFGGGIWACPGRHFVKQQALLTLAVLVTMFDFEIPGRQDIEMCTGRFPFGVLEPKRAIPFRVRLRS